MKTSAPYMALAAIVGIPAGITFGALIPAVAAALLVTNTALWVAYRLWGNEATDA